jgi:acyl-CoA reductase-like NAD-dependent aldehyde dehydrogenase
MPGQGDRQVDASVELQEKFAEWGKLTERQREAVLEGANEKVIEKYRGLVEDYYRELGKKATERKQ